MLAVLADIAHGHTDGADVLFLVALILAGIAAVLAASTTPASRFAAVLGWAALAVADLGLLVL